MSLQQIAKRLKRTIRGVQAKAKREGVSFRDSAILEAGMSIENVSDELGVHRHTVINWIHHGWLKARRMHGLYTVRPESVTEFLIKVGWRLDCLQPTLVWKEVIADIEKEERPKTIMRRDLVQVLKVRSELITKWLRYKNFPKPLPGQSPQYGHQCFSRDAIKQWFEAHRQYWSVAVVKAGFIDKQAFDRENHCSVEGCKKNKHALGYCSNHYKLAQKYPEKYPPPERRKRVPTKGLP